MSDYERPQYVDPAYDEEILERLADSAEARQRRAEFIAAIDAAGVDRLRAALLMIFDDLNGREWDSDTAQEIGEDVGSAFDVYAALD